MKLNNFNPANKTLMLWFSLVYIEGAVEHKRPKEV
jgi:hypothetical protein